MRNPTIGSVFVDNHFEGCMSSMTALNRRTVRNIVTSITYSTGLVAWMYTIYAGLFVSLRYLEQKAVQ